MPIYEIKGDNLRAVSATTFSAEGLYERRHIQSLLRDSIEALDERLLVLAEEFGEWLDSSRRIDLLCLDGNANLVVVELKRTEDGGHMELQALRYASMISAMTFEQAVETLARHRRKSSPDVDEARAAILDFLGWNEAHEEQFARDTRIILAAADFGKELTTAVMWLRDRAIDIRCIRLKPYRMDDGPVLLDVQQLIPLPEAASFQTQIGVKRQAERRERMERHDERLQFWASLLDRAKLQTELHGNRRPTEDNWISTGVGRSGFGLNYVIREHHSRVELWIAQGKGKRAENKKAFSALLNLREPIERAFGAPMVWEEFPDRDQSKVFYDLTGGYRSPQDEWPRIQDDMIDAMIRLDASVRPRVQDLKF